MTVGNRSPVEGRKFSCVSIRMNSGEEDSLGSDLSEAVT